MRRKTEPIGSDSELWQPKQSSQVNLLHIIWLTKVAEPPLFIDSKVANEKKSIDLTYI